MKQTLLISLIMAAQTMAFAQSDSRVETRNRVLGEQTMSVSECSSPEATSSATNVMVNNSRGELTTAPAVYIEGSSSLVVKKCVQSEDYNVNVTGSKWNSKSSEIVGSGKQRFHVTEKKLSFEQSETIRDQKNTTFGGDNTVSVAINIAEGLKSRAAKLCAEKRAQLMQSANANVSCVNQ